MQLFLRVAIAGIIGLALAACPESQLSERGECKADSDCDVDSPHCVNSACVVCSGDEHCSCHQRCVENECIQLASADSAKALHAHGRWDGTPDASGSGAVDRPCEADEDCGVGELCNPFTGGCVVAADFRSRCGPGGSCEDAEPSGVVLACDTTSSRCLPAGLCWVDGQRLATDPEYDPHRNCCDVSTFVCTASDGEGFCVPRQQECTPPAEVTNACPMQPREQAGCAPGLFCSLAGRCVQCTCDTDCDQTGGLRCYAPTGRCVAADFCTQAAECDAGQSCDTTLEQCRPRCSADNQCDGGEYCRTTTYVEEPEADYVCRPRSELPCPTDEYEPNQTAADALVNATKPLSVPAIGTSVDIEPLTVCSDDTDDWYTMELSAGDRIIIRGTSLDGVSADLAAYVADAVTLLDTGRMDNPGTELIDFTANIGGTYYVHLRADSGSQGTYTLNLERQSGVVFDDAFESTNGTNNTVAEATEMNGSGSVPAGCTLNGVLGATHDIDCSGAMAMYVGDVDYYLVEVHANGLLTVTVEGSSSNLDLFLFGPYLAGETVDTSRPLAESTSLGSAPETVQHLSRLPATYLVRVSRTSGNSSIYDLLIDVADGPLCSEDTFDTPAINDAFASASELTLSPGPLTVSDLALCVADLDWYRLRWDDAGSLGDLPAGVRVQATLTATQQTPGDAITLAATTDETTVVGGSTNTTSPASRAMISMTNGGPFYLNVSGAGANAGTVLYELQIDAILPPECDLDVLGDTAGGRNDQPANAFRLEPAAGWPAALGETQETGGVTLCGSDDDWYRIEVPTGASVIASVQYDPTEAEIGLALFDATVLDATVDQGVPPSTGQLDMDDVQERGLQRVRGVPSTTEAYIMVYNRSGWPLAVPPGAGYALRVGFVGTDCFEDSYEENDLWTNAASVPLTPTSVPGLETGVLDLVTMCSASGGELDWFRIDARSGDRIEANVYYDPSEGSLNLHLYPPGPNGLNSSVDADLNDPPQAGLLHVSYALSATDPTGDYLLKVQPHDDSGFATYANLYLVEARVQRACVDDPYQPSTQAEPHTVGSFPFATGEALALCGDDDWYAFVAPGSGPVDVGVCVKDFVNAEGNIDLLVYGADKVSVVAGHAGVDDHEYVSFTATGGETYFARVYMATPKGQTYRLEINDAASVVCP